MNNLNVIKNHLIQLILKTTVGGPQLLLHPNRPRKGAI